MLVNLFKSKTPVAIFSLPLFIGLLCVSIFFIDAEKPTSFFTWQTALVDWTHSQVFIHFLFSFATIYLSAIEINRLVNVYGFYSKNTYFPGFIYGLIVFTFTQFQFSMRILALGFVIYGLGYLFRINRQDGAISSVFMASFLIGIGTVFAPLLGCLILLPWFSLVIFRSFVWREWIMLLIGVAIPWLYHYSIIFLTTGQLDIKREGLAIVNHEISWSLNHSAQFIFLIVLMLFALWRYIAIARNQLLVFKKRSRLLYHLIWLSIIIVVVSWLFYDIINFTFAIPFSIIIGVNFLNSRSPILANGIIIFWLLLISWNLLT